jgi:hypothetical protein
VGHGTAPGKQMVIQFDWSSGHAAGSGDGLSATKMNLKWGGKNAADFSMRDSTLTADMIGPHSTKVLVDGVTVDYGLKAGDVQSFRFGVRTDGQPPPLPPYYDPAAEGFEGQPKGMQQVLFETGWWDPTVKMVGTMPTLNRNTGKRKDNGRDPPAPEHVADLVLGKRRDFREELSELSKVPRPPTHYKQHHKCKNMLLFNLRLPTMSVLRRSNTCKHTLCNCVACPQSGAHLSDVPQMPP